MRIWKLLERNTQSSPTPVWAPRVCFWDRFRQWHKPKAFYPSFYSLQGAKFHSSTQIRASQAPRSGTWHSSATPFFPLSHQHLQNSAILGK